MSCPTPEHIAPLLAGNPLKSLPASASLKVIYHSVGPGVLESEAYVNWLAFMPADTRHIVSAPGYSPNRISFSSAAILQLRLSRIDGEIFKLPHYDLEPQRRLVDSACTSEVFSPGMVADAKLVLLDRSQSLGS